MKYTVSIQTQTGFDWSLDIISLHNQIPICFGTPELCNKLLKVIIHPTNTNF